MPCCNRTLTWRRLIRRSELHRNGMTDPISGSRHTYYSVRAPPPSPGKFLEMEIFSSSLSLSQLQLPSSVKLLSLRATPPRNTSTIVSIGKLSQSQSHLRTISNFETGNRIGFGITIRPRHEQCIWNKSMVVLGLVRASKREDGLPNKIGAGIVIGSGLTVILAVDRKSVV